MKARSEAGEKSPLFAAEPEEFDQTDDSSTAGIGSLRLGALRCG
jgi:hypothetical protein